MKIVFWRQFICIFVLENNLLSALSRKLPTPSNGRIGKKCCSLSPTNEQSNLLEVVINKGGVCSVSAVSGSLLCFSAVGGRQLQAGLCRVLLVISTGDRLVDTQQTATQLIRNRSAGDPSPPAPAPALCAVPLIR